MGKGKDMSEVKRWKHTIIHLDSDEVESSMVTNTTGRYVLYEDYRDLQQKLDAVLAENVALKTLAKACDLEFEGDATFECKDDEKVAYPEDECHITFGMIRSALKTPATDAYLNSVRADAIVEAASRISAQVWEEDEGAGMVAAVNALAIIEKEIRAGEGK